MLASGKISGRLGLLENERARRKDTLEDENSRRRSDAPYPILPDDQGLSAAELAEFRPSPLVRRIRLGLALSWAAFADRFGLDRSTVDDWESGRVEPSPAESVYLRVIAAGPETVERLLATGPSRPPRFGSRE